MTSLQTYCSSLYLKYQSHSEISNITKHIFSDQLTIILSKTTSLAKMTMCNVHIVAELYNTLPCFDICNLC